VEGKGEGFYDQDVSAQGLGEDLRGRGGGREGGREGGMSEDVGHGVLGEVEGKGKGFCDQDVFA